MILKKCPKRSIKLLSCMLPLALLVVPATLVMLTRLLEELQKIYFIQKSSEFNFQEVRQS